MYTIQVVIKISRMSKIMRTDKTQVCLCSVASTGNLGRMVTRGWSADHRLTQLQTEICAQCIHE